MDVCTFEVDTPYLIINGWVTLPYLKPIQNRARGRVRTLQMIKIATCFAVQSHITSVNTHILFRVKSRNHRWVCQKSDRKQNKRQLKTQQFMDRLAALKPSDRLIARLVGIFKVSLQDPQRFDDGSWRGAHVYWCSIQAHMCIYIYIYVCVYISNTS